MDFATRDLPPQEMMETRNSHYRDTFFSLKNLSSKQQRPMSVATEFMESDWEMEEDENEDEEVYSEFELDEGEQSPRGSFKSGQQSLTTLSSVEEAHTPRSSHPAAFPFTVEPGQAVEGPVGPHLFRCSAGSFDSAEFQHALSLSPITPAFAKGTQFQMPVALDIHATPIPFKKPNNGPFRFTDEALDTSDLTEWSPEKVAQWMLNAGVDITSAERFVENDIYGAILVTLKFEDLKELCIPSFGVRTKIWEEIHKMRNIRPTSPAPETPIEDEPSREVRKEQKRLDEAEGLAGPGLKREASKKRIIRPKIGDIVMPEESVSIIGIEQMIPKPHQCSKGENCPKYKRYQKLMEAFKNDHPFIGMDKAGVIMIAGDPGNSHREDTMKKADEMFRPTSQAVPSMIASSDVMGPGMPPLQYLAEASLRNLEQRDPQDNVKHFLEFQRQHTPAGSEVPPTPPFEIFPSGQPQGPRRSLQALPKLSIPGVAPRRQPASAHPAGPQYAEKYEDSPEEETTPTAPYRFGTPFSDMDVPVTSQPMAPIARDVSQSVPPDMNYRQQVPISRSMSRSSRRPSFPVMPALDENAIVMPPSRNETKTAFRPGEQPPLRAPPRVQYPWTKAERGFEKAIAPLPNSSSSSLASAASHQPVNSSQTSLTSQSSAPVSAFSVSSSSTPVSFTKTPMPLATFKAVGGSKDDGILYQGAMKKRKTKMLRHEWAEHYFTLRGTRLAMHKDAAHTNRTLEYVDIDDYAIACSNLASSKLNAAFKAMSILRGDKDKGKEDVAAFSFQLIPQDQKGGVKLRKRDSSMPTSSSPFFSANSGAAAVVEAAPAPVVPGEGVNGTGKAHHFAVKNRDERIDWMRELMLAKALKQKGEGFEVSVNGNMI